MRGTTKTLLLMTVLAAIGGSWALRGDWMPPTWRNAASQLAEIQLPAVTAPAKPPRKCLATDGSLLYSTEPCPAGTREQALKGGTLTVLAAPPSPPASKASAQTLLQRLDDQAETERMRERRMQKALGE